MRLRHPSGRTVFLACTLPTPGLSDLAGLIAHLDRYAAVRERLGIDRLAIDLWLPAVTAAALAVDGRARRRLRTELDARGLEVVTVDGVATIAPAESAGARYLPNWSAIARLDHTLDLARVLVDLLPDDAVRGSLSTLPLAWHEPPWTNDHDRGTARILDRLSAGLTEIAWQTGRAVRVGFQPEPGCVIDTTERAIAALSRVDTDRLGLSLDLGNLACAWEDAADTLGRLATAGLAVVKVRVTAAVEATNPAAAASVLRGYVEPRHRHQVSPAAGGTSDNLDDALRDLPPGPWRVRYQIPVHSTPATPLTATTTVWRSALAALLTGRLPGCDHLAVGAETWDVLPPGERPTNLADAVAAEVAYTRTELIALGLAPPVHA